LEVYQALLWRTNIRRLWIMNSFSCQQIRINGVLFFVHPCSRFRLHSSCRHRSANYAMIPWKRWCFIPSWHLLWEKKNDQELSHSLATVRVLTRQRVLSSTMMCISIWTTQEYSNNNNDNKDKEALTLCCNPRHSATWSSNSKTVVNHQCILDAISSCRWERQHHPSYSVGHSQSSEHIRKVENVNRHCILGDFLRGAETSWTSLCLFSLVGTEEASQLLGAL
jgi:hypothetical protein